MKKKSLVPQKFISFATAEFTWCTNCSSPKMRNPIHRFRFCRLGRPCRFCRSRGPTFNYKPKNKGHQRPYITQQLRFFDSVSSFTSFPLSKPKSFPCCVYTCLRKESQWKWQYSNSPILLYQKTPPILQTKEREILFQNEAGSKPRFLKASSNQSPIYFTSKAAGKKQE